MKFCIVHYNTPELTTCLCSSINKFHDDAEIIIFENSDKRPFPNDLFDNVTILDNSKGQFVDFNKLINENSKYLSKNEIALHNRSGCNWGSIKHSACIQWFIDNLKESFILLDSDVLLKKPLNEFFNSAEIIGDIEQERFVPYVCFLPDNLKEKFLDIKRFNACKMNSDTGGTFIQDIIKNHTPMKRIKWSDYVVHFGNGSWRNSKTFGNLPGSHKGNFKEFLLKYKSLWQ